MFKKLKTNKNVKNITKWLKQTNVKMKTKNIKNKAILINIRDI